LRGRWDFSTSISSTGVSSTGVARGGGAGSNERRWKVAEAHQRTTRGPESGAKFRALFS
jgi:hypothetical protein